MLVTSLTLLSLLYWCLYYCKVKDGREKNNCIIFTFIVVFHGQANLDDSVIQNFVQLRADYRTAKISACLKWSQDCASVSWPLAFGLSVSDVRISAIRENLLSCFRYFTLCIYWRTLCIYWRTEFTGAHCVTWESYISAPILWAGYRWRWFLD